ncbi:SCO-spondin-like isoform X1 [Haliotis rufescens]|uniref:SCO-spondin-like isoform X1 n=1 Tax=Haliotis rufescens TaxID=6454 RepID=UPI001EAFFEA3|nr:SCO-spondin-like isoform X1 [Haliotis rufescens]XP_046359955.1 SCO-spondin-like isoform X1 [Haliotis rufescens]XP_046359956.1 SCO-spondin-like isoform X1 [Haliotis rufescens]XP_046359957.1 SCO-spondin-like isoform X1 [Haliotis rufescens]
MAVSRVVRQLRYCHDNPDEYKLCDNQICVPVDRECPCDLEQFQCLDGRCLHPSLLCDGNLDCLNGEDETICKSSPTSDKDVNPPTSVIAGVCIAIIVVTLAVIAVLVFLRRRRLRSLHRESGSEPLQSGASSSDPSTETEHTSDSDAYRVVPKEDIVVDDFSDFADALCTSTPRPDIRRQVHPGQGRQGAIKASMLMAVT